MEHFGHYILMGIGFLLGLILLYSHKIKMTFFAILALSVLWVFLMSHLTPSQFLLAHHHVVGSAHECCMPQMTVLPNLILIKGPIFSYIPIQEDLKSFSPLALIYSLNNKSPPIS